MNKKQEDKLKKKIDLAFEESGIRDGLDFGETVTISFSGLFDDLDLGDFDDEEEEDEDQAAQDLEIEYLNTRGDEV